MGGVRRTGENGVSSTELELMRAGLRWKFVLLAGGLFVAATPALAQSVPDTTSNTPATDAVGPRELQNFSLSGTASKPADQTAIPAPVAKPAQDVSAASNAVEPSRPPVRREAVHETTREFPRAQSAPVTQEPQRSLAAISPAPSASIAPAPPQRIRVSDAAPEPAPTSNDTLEKHQLPILPWLIAALVLVLATGLILWRRNQQREVFAGAGEFDQFVPTEPQSPAPPPPAPRAAAAASPPLSNPAPVPPRAAAPRAAHPSLQPIGSPAPTQPQAAAAAPRGIVASRLRPALEIGMQPLRCLVDDEQVTIEFEVELFNSGTAPARAVIAEASLFNASASQDQELAAFYAKPPGQGDRIDSIPPMRRMAFINRVVAPRAAVQEYELAGRKAFVPVLAFNAQYEWTGGKGQSSLAFLLGRETRGEKLGPLHLEGGQRELRGLAAHVLPTAIRT